MEDRFKFRVWDGEAMFYDVPILVHSTPKSGVTIMQCTGLKDKNGKLIYEGDIIKYEDYYNDSFEVAAVKFGFYRWDDGEFVQRLYGFYLDSEDEEYSLLNHDWDQILTNKEIIGNIYENPELFEEK